MNDLETRITQAKARLNDLKAAARKQERRNATRRKIIIGAAALQLMSDFDDEKARRLFQLLDRRISRPSDRKFLGLNNKIGGNEQGLSSKGTDPVGEAVQGVKIAPGKGVNQRAPVVPGEHA